MNVMISTESYISAFHCDFKTEMSGNVTANNITLSGKIISSEMTNSIIKV